MLCLRCGETRDSAFYKSGEQRRKVNLCKVCRRLFYKERRLFYRTKAIRLKGGACSKCGYNRNMSALAFHHTDSQDKDNTIANMIYNLRPWSEIENEIGKCVLLCACCHAELHHPDRVGTYQFSFDHSLRSFPRPKRDRPRRVCEQCDEEYVGKNTSKYCSQKCAKKAQRKVERPTREQLNVMLESENMSAIGRKFGVTCSTVRNWKKSFGI